MICPRPWKPSKLANALGISVCTITRWCLSGRIRAWRTPGRQWLIDAGEAERLVAGGELLPAKKGREMDGAGRSSHEAATEELRRLGIRA